MHPLEIVGILFGIAASIVTIVIAAGPVLKAVGRVVALCERLMPMEGPCIVDRMESVESDVRILKNDVHSLKAETDGQTATLDRIEEHVKPQGLK